MDNKMMAMLQSKKKKPMQGKQAPVLEKAPMEETEEEMPQQFTKKPFDGATEEIMSQMEQEGDEESGEEETSITIDGQEFGSPVDAIMQLLTYPGVKEKVAEMM